MGQPERKREKYRSYDSTGREGACTLAGKSSRPHEGCRSTTSARTEEVVTDHGPSKAEPMVESTAASAAAQVAAPEIQVILSCRLSAECSALSC